MDVKSIESTNLDYALLTLSTANFVSCNYFTEYPDIKLRHYASLSQVELEKEGILAYILLHYDVVWTPVTSVCPNRSCQQALDAYITKNLNKSYSKYSSSDGGDR